MLGFERSNYNPDIWHILNIKYFSRLHRKDCQLEKASSLRRISLLRPEDKLEYNSGTKIKLKLKVKWRKRRDSQIEIKIHFRKRKCQCWEGLYFKSILKTTDSRNVGNQYRNIYYDKLILSHNLLDLDRWNYNSNL